MSFEAIWNACQNNDWLLWLAVPFGLEGGSTPNETRALIPWPKMAEALANPPQTRACECCNEQFHPSDLFHGYCEDCEDDRVYCTECVTTHSRDDNHPCAHLRWSDDAGGYVGTGADVSEHDIAQSFDALLVKLGLVLTRKLLIELEKKDFGRRPIGCEFGDCGSRLDELMDERRDVDGAAFEEGLFWLDTLHPRQKQYVSMVKKLVRDHIARREAAIKADKRPRRILFDGGGRVYVMGGTWSAVRAQAYRMSSRKAQRLRRRLKSISPGVKIRVVHVLKPAPPWKGAKR